MPWKTLKSKTILKDSFLNIREDRCIKKDGSIVEKYFVVEKPEVAIIGAFTKSNEIILIKQYRHPVKSVKFEVPAGYAEKKDKNILATAKREFLEETGYTATNFKEITSAYASAGLLNNLVHFFIAFNARKIQEQNLDQNEEIKIKPTPWKKALELVKKGKIKDLGSVSAIYIIDKYLKENRSHARYLSG